MSDAATPAVENKEPNTPTPTPATPAPAAPAAAADEGLTLTFKTKEEKEQFERDAARARSNQSKADRYDRIVGKNGGGHFSPQSQAPVTPPSQEELAEKAKAEDTKAERGLMKLASDPKYRQLLDSDPTLRTMLTDNPLALLPSLAPDAIDAEDAIALVVEALDKRAGAIKPVTPPADDKKPETPAPATPPAGGVNVQTDLPNEAAKEALKNTNTEHAVAGSVRERLKSMGGKSS